MGKRQAIKNIKRVSCRFDMDVPEERRAWQILQGSYQEPPDGKKQDYTSIIAKAMTGYYDRGGETRLTHEELLAKVQESIRREAEGIKKSLAQAPFPMMYPYMQVAQWLVANNLTILKAFFSSIGAMVNHLGSNPSSLHQRRIYFHRLV